jgi:hypothetical protein
LREVGEVRRFAVLAMLVAAWAAVTPTRSFAADAPMECAGYTILRSDTQGDTGPSGRVVIRRGPKVIKTLTGDRITEVQCVEVTGDAVPELSIEWYSGGAHCCTTVQIFQLRPAFREILLFGAGHTIGFTVVRDRQGKPALVLGDSSLAYYGDLCFACSPSSMPLVACYTGARYVDCTRRFPSVVQDTIKTYTDNLREAIRSKDASRIEYMRGAALGVYAGYALLDREADGLAAVRRMVSEPAVTSWLAAQRSGIRKWLKGRPAELAP